MLPHHRSPHKGEALLVTVVRNQKNQGHAVLTVTTDKGDYVLDNQNKNVLLWSETGYRFKSANRRLTPTCGSRLAVSSGQSPRRPHAETWVRRRLLCSQRYSYRSQGAHGEPR